MFCPLCQSEYRAGITHCNDCDVDLVTSFPESPEQIPNPAAKLIWQGVDHRRFIEITDALDGEGIPHTTELPQISILYPSLNLPYQIRVLSTDYERASKLIYGADKNENEDEDDDLSSDSSDVSVLNPGLFIVGRDEPKEPPDDLIGKWFPEDATCDVWAGTDPGLPQILRDCLRENGIGSRVEIIHGATHLFVCPADEAHAREVVRQVVDGTPPA